MLFIPFVVVHHGPWLRSPSEFNRCVSSVSEVHVCASLPGVHGRVVFLLQGVQRLFEKHAPMFSSEIHKGLPPRRSTVIRSLQRFIWLEHHPRATQSCPSRVKKLFGNLQQTPFIKAQYTPPTRRNCRVESRRRCFLQHLRISTATR